MKRTPDIDVTAQEARELAKQALNAAVGDRIRQVREESGMGQAECARAAGIDTSSMFRIETGKQNLTLETLGRLALGLGVSMDILVSGVLPEPGLLGLRSRR